MIKNTAHPLYKTWIGMKRRCSNPNEVGFVYYGGRGITVCASWLGSFEAFLADMGERPTGLTLDRINNDGNYEPGNCRWATAREQAMNRSCSVVEAKRPYTIRVSPEQLARWEASAAGLGRSLSGLIREFVDVGFDRASQDEGRLADLGRDLLALADDYRGES